MGFFVDLLVESKDGRICFTREVEVANIERATVTFACDVVLCVGMSMVRVRDEEAG